MNSDKEKIIALLAASCLFLSTIEYIIPKPIPFLKLGLANLPILIALNILNSREILKLTILKILGQGLIQGTLFSYIFLFSVVSSLASVFAMLVLNHICQTSISLIGLSVIGSIASNLSQLMLARLVIFGESAWLIAPFLLISGTISALILGIVANNYIDQSEWYSEIKFKQSNKSPTS